MVWKKIEGSIPEVWDFSVQPELEGTYIRKEEKVGPNNSNMYYFKVGEEEVAIWGNTVLDNRLDKVLENTKVRIVYLGKARSKRGVEYKNFEVFVWQDEVPF
jgi:hypothetical protein